MPAAVWGWGSEHRGGVCTRAPPSHLDVQIHQLVLPEDVVDPPGLQPGVRLLLLLLQVDEDPQTALGVVQGGLVGPAMRAGQSASTPPPQRALPSARPVTPTPRAKLKEAVWREQGGGGHPVSAPTPQTRACDPSSHSREHPRWAEIQRSPRPVALELGCDCTALLPELRTQQVGGGEGC